MSAVNISTHTIQGNCQRKCNYAFRYSSSSTVVTNRGQYLSFEYDANSPPPVTFNQEKYTVETVRVVSPSIHQYNQTTLPAELIIEHVPVKGGFPFNVCIPITQSQDTSTASQQLAQIITNSATIAPKDGDTAPLRGVTYSLQDIVPQKPFYTYTSAGETWLVFGDLQAIPLASSVLDQLKSIITPYTPVSVTKKPAIYYNSQGPVTGIAIDDGIYISCQPTGSSDETTPVYSSNANSGGGVSFDSPQGEAVLWTLFSILVFIGIFYSLYLAYNARLNLGNK